VPAQAGGPSPPRSPRHRHVRHARRRARLDGLGPTLSGARQPTGRTSGCPNRPPPSFSAPQRQDRRHARQRRDAVGVTFASTRPLTRSASRAKRSPFPPMPRSPPSRRLGQQSEHPVHALVGGNLYVYNNDPPRPSPSTTPTTPAAASGQRHGPVTLDTLRRPAGSELTKPTPSSSNSNLPPRHLHRSHHPRRSLKDSYYAPSELVLAPHTTNIICRDSWDFALSGVTISGGEVRFCASPVPRRASRPPIAVQRLFQSHLLPPRVPRRHRHPERRSGEAGPAAPSSCPTLTTSSAMPSRSTEATAPGPFLAPNGTPEPPGRLHELQLHKPA
jgi:hypothetical protein